MSSVEGRSCCHYLCCAHFVKKTTFKPSRCIFFYNMGKVSIVKLGRGNCDDFALTEQARSAFPAHD